MEPQTYILFYLGLVFVVTAFSFKNQFTENNFDKGKRFFNFFIILPLRIVGIIAIVFGLKELWVLIFKEFFKKKGTPSYINQYIYSNFVLVCLILFYGFMGLSNFIIFILLFGFIVFLQDSVFKLYNPTDTSLFPYVINGSTVWERFGWALLFIIVMICFIGVLCIATYFILFIYTVDLMDILQLKIS